MGAGLLGVLSGLVHFFTSVLYMKKTWHGGVRPNRITWVLFSFLATVNFLSYYFVTQDLTKVVLPAGALLTCYAILALAFWRGQRGRVNPFDWIAFGVGVLAVGGWWYFSSAAFASVLLQIGGLAAMIPTYRSVIGNPKNESATVWLIWSAAYLLLAVNVLLSWTGNVVALVYPALGALADAGIGLLALRRK